MYSEDDINSAVAAGAISAENAAAFRMHMSRIRDMPRGDEENFRLLNSFNDIFVAIGVVIMLFAAGAIGQALAGMIAPQESWWLVSNVDAMTPERWEQIERQNALNVAMTVLLSGLFVAATAWPLAEFFTRRRRMALPSIILLLAFVAGTFAFFAGAGFAVANGSENERVAAILVSLSGLLAAGAAWLHWKRFMVPITIAAGSAAVAGTAIALVMAALGPDNISDPETFLLSLVFMAGLAVFAFAMRWDMSDPGRTTRRSDVAFWLHLLAAPMIAHPIFALIGVTDGDAIGVGAALGVLAVYVAFGFVALAVDRRALLVSALAYVLIALTFLFDRFGAVELTFAFTALVIGSALLTLSAFWSPIRRQVTAILPGSLQARLPVSEALPA
ncbi:hypothetical protein [Qipengyuania sp. JC766]|uniref:hypothetical protein n=1 Tax=Qipengyuania sp. JC766 TaxID=3232139 RepID=UPI00345A3DCA